MKTRRADNRGGVPGSTRVWATIFNCSRRRPTLSIAGMMAMTFRSAGFHSGCRGISAWCGRVAGTREFSLRHLTHRRHRRDAGRRIRQRCSGPLSGRFPGRGVGVLIACPAIAMMLILPFPARGWRFRRRVLPLLQHRSSNTILANVTRPSKLLLLSPQHFLIHALGDTLSPPVTGGSRNYTWNAPSASSSP